MWSATPLKKVDDRFNNNFATCLKMHLLLYKDVNFGFTTNNQKKKGQEQWLEWKQRDMW